MNYKQQLYAFLIVAAFTAAALLLPSCSSSSRGPAEPLPLEFYD